ncbi:MAG: response regulator [Candidatus Omnitrophica bacterium]|nr:response regulator [Candidatus Omnitrophota bacterium]MDD5487743.1 response regulator [Candidatus Omnitrophota bacterium]
MRKAKILVVEDESIIAMEIGSRLENSGYNVVGIVSSGEQAIKRTDEIIPDVILMDIILKGEIDGIETVKEIRKKHTTPIIYITAYSDKETFKRAEETSPYAFLLKPFEEDTLKDAIENALKDASSPKK